jgi:hypothetical protein
VREPHFVSLASNLRPPQELPPQPTLLLDRDYNRDLSICISCVRVTLRGRLCNVSSRALSTCPVSTHPDIATCSTVEYSVKSLLRNFRASLTRRRCSRRVTDCNRVMASPDVCGHFSLARLTFSCSRDVLTTQRDSPLRR